MRARSTWYILEAPTPSKLAENAFMLAGNRGSLIMADATTRFPAEPRSPPERISAPQDAGITSSYETPASASAQVSVGIATIEENLDTCVIAVTEDKLRLAALEHQSAVRVKREWLAPLGILLTVLAAITSSEFRPAYGIDPSTWEAFFVSIGVISAIWLLISINRFLRIMRKGDVDHLVESIKGRAPR